MNTEIVKDEVAESVFSAIDIETILKTALQERDEMISISPLLKEFQSDIDTSINGFEDVTKRLESLAIAARKFNIKRDIPEKIARIENNIMYA